MVNRTKRNKIEKTSKMVEPNEATTTATTMTLNFTTTAVTTRTCLKDAATKTTTSTGATKKRPSDEDETKLNDKTKGFFENVDANRRLFKCLANLAQSEAGTIDSATNIDCNETESTNSRKRALTREKGRTAAIPKPASMSFMKLTKKMKTLYVLNVINDLRNQTVKFNVKKLFQIWLVYHRDDQIVKSICDIVFKSHTYDIGKIKDEILRRNQKLIKTRKQRDDNCRKISENNELLRIFDKKSLNYCLKNFHCTIVELKKKIPTILCFNESDIDHIIDTCRREKNFPIHFLPASIALNVHYLLSNRVPPNVVLSSTSGSKI